METEPGLCRWSLEGFAKRMRAAMEIPDRRFAFFIGASCSVRAGIPDSRRPVKDVWLPRLKEYRAPKHRDFETWARQASLSTLAEWKAWEAA